MSDILLSGRAPCQTYVIFLTSLGTFDYGQSISSVPIAFVVKVVELHAADAATSPKPPISIITNTASAAIVLVMNDSPWRYCCACRGNSFGPVNWPYSITAGLP
ncbi:conserved hypothetical protein [Streptomyces sviceus ATCC 29083]|uniref:Uncharacterized protein n=1 Tax=Streptomyces sviceus (strain ATCC 29083 / DSM 924 / JCM 4929 / NBRC 13980 / NCIMB 11184 / NRRL 5439 / UC 5370) TaxID=463191 RepID=B5I2I8_STRX2|nr:conserved hypothetical protein [Streptomyces sviceus ATCC 29083]